MNGATAAHTYTATVLGTGKFQGITKEPKQRHIAIHFGLMNLTVNSDAETHEITPGMMDG
jgi:hypothetical protein